MEHIIKKIKASYYKKQKIIMKKKEGTKKRISKKQMQ